MESSVDSKIITKYFLRHVRGQVKFHFPCSDDDEQDWQSYPVDQYSAICDDHTHIHTYVNPDNLEKEAGWGAQGTQGSSKNGTSRESVSPLSRLIRGFRNKYHWSPLGRINASGIE